MSPDTVSSLFPDRPIRPLPKRRLRERLSPEVANSIKYPPSIHEVTPLFYYPPHTLKGEGSPISAEPAHTDDQRRHESYRKSRMGLFNADEGDATSTRSTAVTRPTPEILSRQTRRASRHEPFRLSDSQIPPSTASSGDGYESFENTNNNKKRKIPSASENSTNGTHALNHEIGSLTITNGVHAPTTNLRSERTNPHSPTTFGPSSLMSGNSGISGPGRGRLGRPKDLRNPLRALSDDINTLVNRASKAFSPYLSATNKERAGIISNAIANAEKLPPEGQENVSLLQQHSSRKISPATTQFTFTCDSQVPGTVHWPVNTAKVPDNQTAPGDNFVPNSTNGIQHGGSSKEVGGDVAGTRSRKQERRQLNKELRMAARQRQRLAAESHCRTSPRPEDVWICEFCEYERIFGEPPGVLIREYELKDRRHRQEEADRKRVLEKAKAKSRKSRKNGKTSAKGSQVTYRNSVEEQREAPGDQDAHQTELDKNRDVDCEGADDDRHLEPPPHTGAQAQDDGGGEGGNAKGSERPPSGSFG